MAGKKNQPELDVLENGDLVFTATIKRAFIGATKYDDKVKNRVTLYNPDFERMRTGRRERHHRFRDGADTAGRGPGILLCSA